MLTLKLLLIAASVYLSSLAARRGGHTLAGLITGMPMIVGPILALVLIDQGPARTAEISLATLVCFPATLLHAVVFSRAASRWVWPVCLLLASAAYLAFAAVLTWVALPPLAVCLVAALAPAAALRLMPVTTMPTGDFPVTVRIPQVEIIFRMAAAVAMAAAIIVGAGSLPTFFSGLLLAIPIAGAVLPCFTLPRYGCEATRQMLRGFAWGLHGFCAFCILLVVLLPRWPSGISFGLALLGAALTAWLLRLLKTRPASA